MEKEDYFGTYKTLAIIFGIAIFVVYIWIQRTGWQLVLNEGIRYTLLITGFSIFIFLIIYLFQKTPIIEKKFSISKFITIPLLFVGVTSLSVSYFEIDYVNLDYIALLNTVADNINNYSSLLGIVLAIVCFPILVTFIIQAIIQEYNSFKEKILEIANKNYRTLNQIATSESNLDELIESHKFFARRSNASIFQAKEGLKKQAVAITQKEKERRRIEREGEIEEQKRNKNIIKLFEFFKGKDSADSIPKWAIYFDKDMIKEAQKKFDNHKDREYKEERELERIEELKEEATNYILEHKALPADYHEFSEETKSFYDEAFDQFEKGELEPKIEIKHEDEGLVKNSFFLANELSTEEKERFIKNYGYRNYSFSHLDGKLGNNLVIKNNSKTESNYHFCMKHLIARIDEVHSIIEYAIKDMRADVAFIFGEKRIAVEVEKGTNNEKQIKKKVDWLNKHFDYWIITAPKKEQKHYRKYVDRKKSFCLGSKKTEEKITELKEQLRG